MKNKWFIAIACAAVLVLGACEKEAKVPEQSDVAGEVVKDDSQKEQVIQEAHNLFHNLINIGADSSEKELKKIVEENVYNPAEYLEALVKNDLSIEYGNYSKATVAHRDEVLKKVGEGHYLYQSYAGIDMHAGRESVPVTGYAEVTMELKEKNGSLKVLKLDLQPSGEK